MVCVGGSFAAEFLTTQVESAERGGLKRVLGWQSLTMIGIGGTIGAGIFVVTGVVAHNITGPGLTLSYVVAGLACAFAALCYAEFASMAPISGSAYTYAYATLGEVIGWIIGWDLVLEYGVSSAAVAQGWSKHFQALWKLMGAPIPLIISAAPFDIDAITGSPFGTGSAFDLSAFLISAFVAFILVLGIKESAEFNNGTYQLPICSCDTRLTHI